MYQILLHKYHHIHINRSLYKAVGYFTLNTNYRFVITLLLLEHTLFIKPTIMYLPQYAVKFSIIKMT